MKWKQKKNHWIKFNICLNILYLLETGRFVLPVSIFFGDDKRCDI
jgi:hypothetical protein